MQQLQDPLGMPLGKPGQCVAELQPSAQLILAQEDPIGQGSLMTGLAYCHDP
jgi:hypothetical protein